MNGKMIVGILLILVAAWMFFTREGFWLRYLIPIVAAIFGVMMTMKGKKPGQAGGPQPPSPGPTIGQP